LQQHNEKLGILQYPELCVPTLVSADITRMKQFWKTHESVIFKPLDTMGGNNVMHIAEDGRNLTVILQWLTEDETVPIMAQRYIPEINTQGDKRILLINGDPVPYAFARFAAPGESRANLGAGGMGTVVPISERDRYLCAVIGPSLRAQSLHFVGIDVIGDYITEINVTSPTCARQISAETGLDIIGSYLTFLASCAKS
jgi:glutathione synthase